MTDPEVAPLAEIRQAGIQRLRSMSHNGELRALVAASARLVQRGMLTVVA